MANVQKYAASAAGHLAAHYERRKVLDPESGEMEYIRFGNQQIDLSRSHLNYNLAPHRDGGQIEFIRQRTSEARTLKRDDVKVLCSWVVTLPRKDEFSEDRIYTDQEIRDFFQEAYQVLAERYGEKNVVSSYVHMDETTPHMHFAFVPVAEDKKRGGEKVSAKDVLTRQDLQTLHVDLQRRMDERFGDGFFPVLNGNTVGGSRTIVELKTEQAMDDLSMIDTELFRTKLDLEETQKTVAKATKELRRKTAEADELVESKRQELQERRQELQETLERLGTVKRRVEGLAAEETALEASVEALRAEGKELLDKKKVLREELDYVRRVVAAEYNRGDQLLGSGWQQEARKVYAQLRDARERINELEKKVQLFERFIAWAAEPIKQAWRQFQDLIRSEREKKQKKRRDEQVL